MQNTIQNAQNNEKMGGIFNQSTNNTNLQKDPPKTQDFSELEILKQYIYHKIHLIPTRPTSDGGFYQLKSKKINEIIKIKNVQLLEEFYNSGVRRFVFIPKNHNLLVIDIDNKNGINGTENWKKWLNSVKRDFKNHSCYVQSPNGGFHLYFRIPKINETKIAKTEIMQGVEIKYTHNITCGGSQKDGKPYILRGNLGKIPLIPLNFLDKIFEEKKIKTTSTNSKTYNTHRNPEKFIEFTRKNYPNDTPHNFILHCAVRLKKENFTLQESLEAIEQTPEHQNREKPHDTTTCVKSVFKK